MSIPPDPSRSLLPDELSDEIGEQLQLGTRDTQSRVPRTLPKWWEWVRVTTSACKRAPSNGASPELPPKSLATPGRFPPNPPRPARETWNQMGRSGVIAGSGVGRTLVLECGGELGRGFHAEFGHRGRPQEPGCARAEEQPVGDLV